MSDDDWDEDDSVPTGFTGQRLTEQESSKYTRNYGFGDNQRRGPRPRNPNDERLIFQIASKDTGKLIGRAGSRIKELKEQTGCQVIEKTKPFAVKKTALCYVRTFQNFIKISD
jgi:hypothetical protein